MAREVWLFVALLAVVALQACAEEAKAKESVKEELVAETRLGEPKMPTKRNKDTNRNTGGFWSSMLYGNGNNNNNNNNNDDSSSQQTTNNNNNYVYYPSNTNTQQQQTNNMVNIWGPKLAAMFEYLYMSCKRQLGSLKLTKVKDAYYFFYTDATGARLNWYAARDYCNSKGMRLVSLETAAEATAIIDKLTNTYLMGETGADGQSFFMTGLNDQANEGRWFWQSGAPLTYVTWADLQPDNGGINGNEDCAILSKQSGAVKYFDGNCDTMRGRFICELSSTCNDIFQMTKSLQNTNNNNNNNKKSHHHHHHHHQNNQYTTPTYNNNNNYYPDSSSSSSSQETNTQTNRPNKWSGIVNRLEEMISSKWNAGIDKIGQFGTGLGDKLDMLGNKFTPTNTNNNQDSSSSSSSSSSSDDNNNNRPIKTKPIYVFPSNTNTNNNDFHPHINDLTTGTNTNTDFPFDKWGTNDFPWDKWDGK